MKLNIWLGALLLTYVSLPTQAQRLEYILTIKDHLFYPSQLVVPAGQKFKLIIINHDDTPEEFDSFDLNREKVIYPHSRATVYIGPLTPGTFHFFGEFNPTTATGWLIAKAPPSPSLTEELEHVN